MRFENKVAIVTGSGGGIGQAYAEALAREGAAVVVADIKAEAAEGVAKQIVADGAAAIHLPVDVSDPDSAKAMADATVAEFGGIDYLVNNAAIYGGMKLDLLLTVPFDYYKKFMSVNLDGALWCTRAVYRKMAKRGGGRPADKTTGFFIEPTVIAGLGNDARVAREEIFGPVLTVIAHDGDDDAVRIANDSPYGLSGTVMSADPQRAARVASRLRVGTVNVNGGVWYSADAPFGGYKQSGIGREMGLAGFEEYLETKLVATAV